MSKSPNMFLRRVLISPGMLAGFVLGGLAMWLLVPTAYLAYAIPLSGFASAWSSTSFAANYWHLGYAVASAMAYGFFRAVLFHPLNNRQYGVWLVQTPWRYPQALPLGPLHLVVQDAIAIAVMVAIAALPSGTKCVYVVPIAFLVCYSLGLSLAHRRRQARWSLITLAFLTGVVLLTIRMPIVSLGVAALLACAISPSIRLSLQDFPYSEDERRELKLLTDKDLGRVNASWLAALLSRRDQERADVRWLASPEATRKRYYDLSYVDALLVGAAIGWAIFCITFHSPTDQREGAQILAHIYLMIFSFPR